MKRIVVVLAACGSTPDKLDKLGPDDIAEADRIRTPQPGDILPEWEPLFIEGMTWKIRPRSW